MHVLGLFFHRVESVYQAGKQDDDLSDLQKEWVIGIPANQEKFQMTSGFNRKFSTPVNLQVSDFSKSCFCAFSHVATQYDRLRMWLNVGTLLFRNTKENEELHQYPFDRDLAKLQDAMVLEAIDDTMRRKLHCLKHLLEHGEVAQARAYIDGELKEIGKRKMNKSIKK